MTDMPDEDGPGFHLFAKLGLSIESLASEVKRQNDINQQHLKLLPRYIPIERMTQANALIDFGTPQNGRVWIVRLLGAAESPDPTVANVAVVTWYIGPYVPGSSGANLMPVTSVRDVFNGGLPQFKTYTSNVHQIREQQHLVAGVTAVPASPHNAIGLVAAVLDQPLWSAAEVVAAQ